MIWIIMDFNLLNINPFSPWISITIHVKNELVFLNVQQYERKVSLEVIGLTHKKLEARGWGLGFPQPLASNFYNQKWTIGQSKTVFYWTKEIKCINIQSILIKKCMHAYGIKKLLLYLHCILRWMHPFNWPNGQSI